MVWDQEAAGSTPATPTTLSRNSEVEFFPDTEAVVGSNPTVTTQCLRSSVGLEHLTFNEGVTGSSPVGDTTVRYPSGLRGLSAKQVFVGSNPTLTSKV